MEAEGNGGSEQPSSSEAKPVALAGMTKEDIERTVFDIVQRAIEPVIMSAVENLSRIMVQQATQAPGEKLLTGASTSCVHRNDMLEERCLHLEFLIEVLDPVATGVELKGVGNDTLKVALLDAAKNIVTCEPESSAEVEIILIDASGKDDANNSTHENFEKKIIGVEDKEKPHFAASVNICLEKGVGHLSGIKLRRGKCWSNVCYCRLGARIVQNIRGVREACTMPFKVIDKRVQNYEKHDIIFPKSEVWRLKGISRFGKRFGYLKAENIILVEDLLFWQYVDPVELLRISQVKGSSQWKIIVDHALTCKIDDKKMYSYTSSTEAQLSVIYNSAGELKGVIQECCFRSIDSLSDVEKAAARNSLKEVLKSSAFGERYNCDVNCSTNLSVQQYANDNDLNNSGNIGVHQTVSSSEFSPGNFTVSGPSNSPGPKDMEELPHTASDVQQNTGLTFGPSMLSEKRKAGAEEPLASASSKPYDDVNEHLRLPTDPPDGGFFKDLPTGLLGESCSKRSNTSLTFVNSPEYSFLDDIIDLADPGPLNPDPFHNYACSHNREVECS